MQVPWTRVPKCHNEIYCTLQLVCTAFWEHAWVANQCCILKNSNPVTNNCIEEVIFGLVSPIPYWASTWDWRLEIKINKMHASDIPTVRFRQYLVSAGPLSSNHLEFCILTPIRDLCFLSKVKLTQALKHSHCILRPLQDPETTMSETERIKSSPTGK